MGAKYNTVAFGISNFVISEKLVQLSKGSLPCIENPAYSAQFFWTLAILDILDTSAPCLYGKISPVSAIFCKNLLYKYCFFGVFNKHKYSRIRFIRHPRNTEKSDEFDG